MPDVVQRWLVGLDGQRNERINRCSVAFLIDARFGACKYGLTELYTGVTRPMVTKKFTPAGIAYVTLNPILSARQRRKARSESKLAQNQ